MSKDCKYRSICQNRTEYRSCFCVHRLPIQESNRVKDRFLSGKCGAYSMLCANRYNPEICLDCDPFDAPCSLFKYKGVQ